MSETVDTILQDPALAREVRRRLGRATAAPVAAGLEKAADLRAAMQGNAALEKVIELVGRPCFFVRHGIAEIPLGDVWGLRLAGARQALERAIRASARVEVSDSSGSRFEGTAWLVAPGLAVTNRHVALTFARRNDDGSGTIRKDFKKKTLQVRCDFLEEYQVDQTYEVDVVSVPYIAEDDDAAPDVALLKLAIDKKLPLPIPLAATTPVAGKEAWVVAIGYPAIDPDEDPKVRADIFKDVFDVKRIAPGVVKSVEPGDWFFKHDCSTLGGNSGSLLLDVVSGGVAGLHFKGYKRQANYAVRVEDLRKVLEPVLKGLEAKMPPTVGEANEGVLEVDRGLPVGGEEGVSSRTAAALATREGYVPAFLGHGVLSIPRPKRVRSRANDAVKLKDSEETVLSTRTSPWKCRRSAGCPCGRQ